jgi:hypothetical protein
MLLGGTVFVVLARLHRTGLRLAVLIVWRDGSLTSRLGSAVPCGFGYRFTIPLPRVRDAKAYLVVFLLPIPAETLSRGPGKGHGPVGCLVWPGFK